VRRSRRCSTPSRGALCRPEDRRCRAMLHRRSFFECSGNETSAIPQLEHGASMLRWSSSPDSERGSATTSSRILRRGSAPWGSEPRRRSTATSLRLGSRAPWPDRCASTSTSQRKSRRSRSLAAASIRAAPTGSTPECGNGVLEAGEQCDPGIKSGTGKCKTAADCQPFQGGPALCLTKTYGTVYTLLWTGGYCAVACDRDAPKCPAGTVCWGYGAYFGSAPDFCLRPCTQPGDCRPDYWCYDGRCIPPEPH